MMSLCSPALLSSLLMLSYLGCSGNSAGGADAEIGDAVHSDAPVDASIPGWECSGETFTLSGVSEGEDIQPALQNAANAADNGDCIEIPAGQFLFHNTLTTSKRISLIGAGSGDGGTLLAREEGTTDETLETWRNMVLFLPNTSSTDELVIKDIHFKGVTGSVVENDGLSVAQDTGLRFVRTNDFVVTGCVIENFGASGIHVDHTDDESRGLIYKNRFIHNVKGTWHVNAQTLGYGVVVYASNLAWSEDPEFGTDNFIFVEDNYFFEHRHAIAAGGNARYVFRHNEVIDTLWGHGIDAHEGRGTGLGHRSHFSTRAVEIYENDIHNYRNKAQEMIMDGDEASTLARPAVVIRGGEAIVHNNRYSGVINFLHLWTQEHNFPAMYPIPSQIGYLSALALGADHTGTGEAERDGDFFEWDNTYESPLSLTGFMESRIFKPEYHVAGRDYHLETQRPAYSPYTYPHPGRLAEANP